MLFSIDRQTGAQKYTPWLANTLLFSKALYTPWFNCDNQVSSPPATGCNSAPCCFAERRRPHPAGGLADTGLGSLQLRTQSPCTEMPLRTTQPLWHLPATTQFYILFKGIIVFALEKRSRLSLPWEPQGKARCAVKISFNSYKLNPHKAKSNNLAMKTWSLPFYLKLEPWR